MIYKEKIFKFHKTKTHTYETYAANMVVYVWFCETYNRVGDSLNRAINK